MKYLSESPDSPDSPLRGIRGPCCALIQFGATMAICTVKACFRIECAIKKLIVDSDCDLLVIVVNDSLVSFSMIVSLNSVVRTAQLTLYLCPYFNDHPYFVEVYPSFLSPLSTIA